MQLLLKDHPVMEIQDNGACRILDHDRLPFALRKDRVSLEDFIEWASGRTLSIGRSYAKEILNTLRLSQTNRYAVCKACRGLNLEDAYWIRQDGDEKTWQEVNLYYNPLSLFVTEVSLSGTNVHYTAETRETRELHTPELTTLGASAKGWIRRDGTLYLHKVGKYEIPADQILTALDIPHIHYQLSTEEETDSYLTEERKQWIRGVGEAVVNSRIFTSEDVSFVTFEEFRIYCENNGMNAFREAFEFNNEFYIGMQIADYLLNNNDRHEQNWGFLMDNATGKLTRYCPLFDHDHAFSSYENILSQTTEFTSTLKEAAREAWDQLPMDLRVLDEMDRPELLSEQQWRDVLGRKEELERGL